MSSLNAGKFESKLALIINETVKNEAGKNVYKEIARHDMPYPLLKDFGIDAEVSMKDGKPEVDEDGIVVYTNEAFDWLQFAIIQQCKAQNRNKTGEDGKLKDGQQFPDTFELLTAVGERSGEALKNRHAAKASFAGYLKAKNKSDVVVKVLSDLFVDAQSIAVAKDDFVDALSGHIQAWAPALNEADKQRFSRTVEKAVEAINGRNLSLDDLK